MPAFEQPPLNTGRRPRPVRAARGALAAATAAVLLAGCSQGTPATSASDAAAASGMAASTTPSAPITVADAWVKAVPSLGSTKMTGIFARLTNSSGGPVTITAAATSASGVTELHETVTVNGAKAMRKAGGGFEIAPGATRELRPGGDHIMAMALEQPIAVGETVTVTLTTSAGQSVSFGAVAKEFTGGQERYATGAGTAPPPTPTAAASPVTTG